MTRGRAFATFSIVEKALAGCMRTAGRMLYRPVLENQLTARWKILQLTVRKSGY